EDCGDILRRLSGQTHEVVTAVALIDYQGQLKHRLSRNEISFRPLGEAEIEAYCASAEPHDKAGAYAIQGKAAKFIQHMTGSYSAVMGLPLFETAQLLQQAGLRFE
ncbi:MAG: Maf family protein, partial [Gammaproteobacteria bacterium]|nr:Maf family protein [Gammaproteobacteria bacterium]